MWKIILIIIITAAVAIAGTYFFLADRFEDERAALNNQINELQGEVQEAEREAGRQQDTATRRDAQESTTDWETYRNTEEDFSVKYPPDWDVTTDTNEGLVVITNFEYPAEGGTEITGDQTKRIFRAVPKEENQSVRELNNEVAGQDERILEQTTVPFEDGQATKFKVQGNFAPFYRVYFPDTDRVVLMTSIGSETNLDNMIRSFDYIGQ